jgi:uncharacterized metal-binding protein YceD (DUF177 family)
MAGDVEPSHHLLRPGDTLLIRVNPTATLDTIEYVRDQMLLKLPGVNVVVVACDDLAVYRPE